MCIISYFYNNSAINIKYKHRQTNRQTWSRERHCRWSKYERRKVLRKKGYQKITTACECVAIIHSSPIRSAVSFSDQ